MFWLQSQTVLVAVGRADALAFFTVNVFMFVVGVIVFPMVLNFAVQFIAWTFIYSNAASSRMAKATVLIICSPFLGLLWVYENSPTVTFYLLWIWKIVVFISRIPELPFVLAREVVLMLGEFPVLVWFLIRLFFRPSPAPLPVEQGAMATLFGQGLPEGTQFALAEGLVHCSTSGALSSVPRLRPRGRATRALQGLLQGPVGSVGKFIRGRWVPDLPASRRSPVLNALLATSGSEMKLLGVGVIQSTVAPVDNYVYVVVETPEGRELVFPALAARLSQYSLLRERTPELLRGLRARAVDWLKESKLPGWVGPLVLPTAVARACLKLSTETLAETMLEKAGLSSLLSSPC